MMSPKFTVAICGGGVAGLTASLAISHFSSERKDILVDLYEATPGFAEVGAGIGIQRRTWKVMKALGLEDALRRLAHVPSSDDELQPTFEARKSDQPEGLTFQYPRIPCKYTDYSHVNSFSTADFQQCLVENLDPNVIHTHFSKRLIGYSLPSKDVGTPGRITLKFKDASEAQCDVLIGADGIRSATRHTMLELAASEIEHRGTGRERQLAETLMSPGKLDPIWSGSVAYRALIPREQLAAVNPSHRALNRMMNYTGKNKHVIVYPVTKGKLINVVAFVSQPGREGTLYNDPWVTSREKSEVVAAYKGWETEVQQLIQCMNSPSCWAIHSLKELPKCAHDRVAIIGDAAHAMTPHQGSGAGVAIEDAYILGALLAHPLTTFSTLPVALKAFEAVCLQHGNDVQQRSRLQGQMYEYADPRFSSLADRTISDTEECQDDMEELKALGDAFIANRKWNWETDAHDNLTKAIAILEVEVPSEMERVSRRN
ncbi:FAD/NAD-binding domain-containing protein [Sanghuangporus baumii]|uniref:FAD/NAD-binding domain-containing protein n=1 Tax=Sanghuangporus baumii TaxID=108892 RepID=A0A9Q5HQB9_SANBA|nr:FAD/NAD-binding domain-containing protein [Sanghuangporus baumii]